LKKNIWLCLALFLAVVALYGRAIHWSFIGVDDYHFVVSNPFINHGLTMDGIRGEFSKHFLLGKGDYWAPVSAISHMIDFSIYGFRSGGHHFTNVLIHALNSILLFLILFTFTKLRWESAATALIFAVHPMNVEAVCWVVERKGLLATFFGLLTIWIYYFYTQKPSWKRMLLVMLLFQLGLMAKISILSLPAVLLTLDYWPLNRLRKSNFPRLFLEKVPLGFLSIFAAMQSFAYFGENSRVVSVENLGILERILRGVHSWSFYIKRFFNPESMSLLLAYPSKLPISWVVSGLLLFAGVLVAMVVVHKKMPWCLSGMLFYSALIFPFLGFLQIGRQWVADRYFYMPAIGLAIGFVWTISRGFPKLRSNVMGWGVLIFFTMSWVQIGYWKNTASLFAHAITLHPEIPTSHHQLALGLIEQRDFSGARKEFEKTLLLDPTYSFSWNALGELDRSEGNLEAAIYHFRKGIECNGNSGTAQLNFAKLLIDTKRYSEAEKPLLRAAALLPKNPEGFLNLTLVYIRLGRFAEARKVLLQAQSLGASSEVVKEFNEILNAVHQ